MIRTSKAELRRRLRDGRTADADVAWNVGRGNYHWALIDRMERDISFIKALTVLVRWSQEKSDE